MFFFTSVPPPVWGQSPIGFGDSPLWVWGYTKNVLFRRFPSGFGDSPLWVWGQPPRGQSPLDLGTVSHRFWDCNTEWSGIAIPNGLGLHLF